ncbi:hypothetical protein NIES2135_53850 [Leptolyngbya boryana NIES-2135]|jgi:hypothetical protein|uniref:Uncharacterized protein n=1 Tax=Leptolyngbya boryana NIES-2135 TaxID=1973484 RepID=A0A1Z4JP28_LEPBY|nr:MULTISPECIES: hypothetical protein [Leptolyngbya]BAY58512.1 hypothetical protein NIES2135_53850 [Leptolyngbya boryana NIES-2135]MBD2370987.1 hypothetical protein [Leptolyngbya sp. FACHB-161]MBD2377501.1 hypothetical protein [Leptolyngbya sp. FACHB-238]MBD2401910.1 hypothetical protein [Leptolyngbya sp. FACHB-239]MBD2408427.1 hypothetical protein [Leptolyngbya sp. FACHB-402]
MTYYDRYLQQVSSSRTQQVCESTGQLAKQQAAIEFSILRNLNGMTDHELSQLISQEIEQAQQQQATQFDLIRHEWQMRLAFMSAIFALKSRIWVLAAFVLGLVLGVSLCTAWIAVQPKCQITQGAKP